MASRSVMTSAGTNANKSWCIGIDIGTQVCSAAVCKDGVVVDVPLEELDDGDTKTHLLPANVSVADSGFLVGSEARKRAKSGDPSTVFDFVRIVGRKLSDLNIKELSKWPFKVASGENDRAVIEISTNRNGSTTLDVLRTFHPEELLAVLIRSIKEKAEAMLGAKVDLAVVCVPGGFNHTQRHAVRNACAIAGLRVEKLLGAATAAAISFGLGISTDVVTPVTQLVLVVDIGASTTDIALVSVLANKFEVKAVDSDLNLGGGDFTERIAAHCHRKKTQAVIPSEANNVATSQCYAKGANQIRHACELAKKLLSSSLNAIVGIDSPASDTFGFYTVTRAGFETFCRDLWHQVLERVHRVIQESSVSKADISTVLLIGGSFHIPRLQSLFRESFPDQEVVVVVGGQPPPVVSPAHGAAAFYSGVFPVAKLLEVTPLSLGIQSVGGTRILMIPRNTSIPMHKSFIYYANCQQAVIMYVVEGDNFGKPNESLHRLSSIRVDGSLATKHLVLKIDITFEINSLDHMVVTAIERSSGRKVTTAITGDDTVLTANAIAHANARLENRIADSTAMVLVPRNSVLQIPHLTGKSLLSTQDPIQLLEEYVQALEVAIESDRLGVALSREDKALVSAIGATLSSSRRVVDGGAGAVAREAPPPSPSA